ncbi:universal stress protein [Haloarchaeobius amylolyticus]|uniref:Universal stress protein n=1 Tax=Haloarchaeobius amylolyticus TaxID=1198296 RepID=A0ABD6BF88_9EURY
MYDTILVPTDGSDAANRAIEHAVSLARTFDAELYGLYVIDTRRYGEQALGTSGGVLEELGERGREVLADLEERADADHVPVTTEVIDGRPSSKIIAYADEVDADLIVLGNRGLGGGLEGTIGSNAERVVRYGDRPVITA